MFGTGSPLWVLVVIVFESMRFFVGVVCGMFMNGSGMCFLVVGMMYGPGLLVHLMSISVVCVAWRVGFIYKRLGFNLSVACVAI